MMQPLGIKNIIKANAFNIRNTITVENATRVTDTGATLIEHVLATDNVLKDHRILNVKVNTTCETTIRQRITKLKLDKNKMIESIEVEMLQRERTTFSRNCRSYKQCEKRMLQRIFVENQS
ncbi:hypothetical protein HHI36_020036 [Cryptolaemus montrouzieri]|uniref:Uncharacterized protein n=1 Tax=Cryptolaemus montrouzieri TaxID=559131 RepID=A0ABD2N9E3_9CUCU